MTPQMLAQLDVGESVSFFVTDFLAWDYLHAEGYIDTYVANPIAQNLKILAFEEVDALSQNEPLLEVLVLVEGRPSDILGLVTARYYLWRSNHTKSGVPRQIALSPREDGLYPASRSDTVMMTHSTGELPVYCEGCETITRSQYIDRNSYKPPICQRRTRRGTELTVIEVKCLPSEIENMQPR